MKKFKNVGAGHVSAQKGITLIALIITIIVMLILVAVTISMAINGGLFEKAGEAVGETQNEINKEQELASGRIQVDGMWYASVDDYLRNKPEPTAVYAKLYTDGTLILSSYDYTDETREVSEDYEDVSNLCDYTIDPDSAPRIYGECPGWFGSNGGFLSTPKNTKVIILDKIAPQNTAGWFYNVQSIENIENLYTNNVTDMAWMFSYCKLTSIDLSSFDTSKVTNMPRMFEGCSALRIDLSSFDTSKVTDMSQMFSYSSGLNTIYVSNKWSNESATSISVMFRNCTNLRGAISYDSSKIDSTYANYSTGYFTYKEAPAL